MGNTPSTENERNAKSLHKLSKPRLGGRRDSRLFSLSPDSKPERVPDDPIKADKRRSFFKDLMSRTSPPAVDNPRNALASRNFVVNDTIARLSPTRSMPNLQYSTGFLNANDQSVPPIPALPSHAQPFTAEGSAHSSSSANGDEVADDRSIPVRRRSLLVAPRAGTATRKPSLKLQEDSALGKLAALDLAEHPRTPTPTSYSVIGAFKRGSLVITNGAASPAPSSIEEGPQLRSVSGYRSSVDLSPGKLRRDSAELSGMRGSIELNGPRSRVSFRPTISSDTASPLQQIMTHEDNLSAIASLLPFETINVKSVRALPEAVTLVHAPAKTATESVNTSSDSDKSPLNGETTICIEENCGQQQITSTNQEGRSNVMMVPASGWGQPTVDGASLTLYQKAPEVRSTRANLQQDGDSNVANLYCGRDLLSQQVESAVVVDKEVASLPLPISELMCRPLSLRNGISMSRSTQSISRGDGLSGGDSNSSSRPSLSDSGYSSYSSMTDINSVNWKLVSANKDAESGDDSNALVMKDHRRSWVSNLRDEDSRKRDSGMEIADEPPFVSNEDFDEDEEKRFSQTSMLAPLPVFGQGNGSTFYGSYNRPRSMNHGSRGGQGEFWGRNQAQQGAGGYPPPRPLPHRQYHRTSVPPTPRRLARQGNGNTVPFKEHDFNPLFHDDNPGPSPYDRAALAMSSMSPDRPGLARARTTITRPKSLIMTSSAGFGPAPWDRSSSSILMTPPGTAGSLGAKSATSEISSISEKRKKRRSLIFSGLRKEDLDFEDIDEWKKEQERWGNDVSPPSRQSWMKATT